MKKHELTRAAAARFLVDVSTPTVYNNSINSSTLSQSHIIRTAGRNKNLGPQLEDVKIESILLSFHLHLFP